jgi:hypothetical protein
MSVVSTYTLFGMFETPEAAQHAAVIIQDAVTRVRDWFVAHPDERLGTWEDMPSPVEFEIAETYQLNWNKNWGLFLCYEFRTFALDRLVIVHEEEREWNVHHEVLEKLMERLGAKEITIQDSVDAQIRGIDVHLSCTAPDTQTADHIYRESERYFEIPLDYESFIVEQDLNEYGVIDLANWFGFEEGMPVRVVAGRMQRQGERELRFDFQMYDIEKQFPNFIKSLRELGFTNINFTFTQAEEAIWSEFGNGR